MSKATNLIECKEINIDLARSVIQEFYSIPWDGELLNAVTGSKPFFRTKFKCFLHEDKLYLLIDCEDTDIRATMTEPNSKVALEEAVEIFIAPGSGDPLVYYEFQLSPANVRRQVKVSFSNDSQHNLIFDDSWYCKNLETYTFIQGYLNEPQKKSKGWQGVFCIPLSELIDSKRLPKVNDIWRLNIFRIDRWPQEMYCAWRPTFLDPPSFHSPKHFGYLILK